MAEAKIEIRAKEIWATGDGVVGYHSYIIYTNSNNEKYILRGGPENQNGLIGDLRIEGADTNLPYTKDFAKIHHDWEGEDSSIHHYTSLPIATGTDAEMLAKFQLMQAEGRRINERGFDYEIAGQNCNTAMRYMVTAAGLSIILPKDDKGKDVILWGLNDTLRNGLVDRVSNWVDDLTPTENQTITVYSDAIHPVTYTLMNREALQSKLDEAKRDFDRGLEILGLGKTQTYEDYLRERVYGEFMLVIDQDYIIDPFSPRGQVQGVNGWVTAAHLVRDTYVA